MVLNNLQLTTEQKENLLKDLWMLCDARWFLKSTQSMGPVAANKLNLMVVGSFGKTEIRRLMAETQSGPIGNIQEFKDLLNFASNLYFPKEHVYEFDIIDERTLKGRILECYVHKAVSQSGGTDFYICAGETRLSSWLTGSGLSGRVVADKDTRTCGGSCEFTFTIDW
jgi:hypothetical protein